MAGQESWVDGREWRTAAAALADECNNPIDDRFIGRDMHADERHPEYDARGMSGGHAGAGAELDDYCGSGAKRKQRKSRGASHVPGQRL